MNLELEEYEPLRVTHPDYTQRMELIADLVATHLRELQGTQRTHERKEVIEWDRL